LLRLRHPREGVHQYKNRENSKEILSEEGTAFHGAGSLYASLLSRRRGETASTVQKSVVSIIAI
jgi:hypothetical protein